jgi:XTP/dITP diphosphohydrolase
MRLLLSTRNKHKVTEIRAIFTTSDLELIDLGAFPDAPEVVEDGDTFEANAVKKARALALWSGLWTLADDSGLEVDALGGVPGVYSARYAGEPVDYRRNNDKLLAELSGPTDRTARFRCVIALSAPDGRSQSVEGRCEGTITDAWRGDGGFGYDPLFLPDGYEQTFAEMSSELKNRISHRANALRRAEEAWCGGEAFGF